LSQFFKTGKLSEGVTRELLENYRTVARWAIKNLKEGSQAEQVRRLKMIEDALRQLR